MAKKPTVSKSAKPQRPDITNLGDEQGRDIQPAHTCQNCPFWKKATKDIGECRYSSPHVHLSYMQGAPAALEAVWPMTKSDEWCGQHPKRYEESL